VAAAAGNEGDHTRDHKDCEDAERDPERAVVMMAARGEMYRQAGIMRDLANERCATTGHVSDPRLCHGARCGDRPALR
jgi:hypothetical protein